MIPTTPMTDSREPAPGSRLVVPPGTLALAGNSIEAQARGGLCRLVLRQRFENPHPEPLRITYSLPVPEDAAVSGFTFTVGDRRIVGEIDRKASARERFEDAILEGKTAALLDEERSTVFTQEIGNIPPGQDLEVEIEIDQLLRWLEDGQWELRVPTTVAPRFLGAGGRVPDAEAVSPDVADGSTGIGLDLQLSVQDCLEGLGHPHSPSHQLACSAAKDTVQVTFANETAALDRDVVVRWPTSRSEVGSQLTMADSSAVPGRSFGLLSLVPPEPKSARRALSRELVLLLDTSGSMNGEPLVQAKRIASTLVSSLTERDTLEMVQFSWSPRRWKRKAVRMDEEGRREALAWVDGLWASGGTEMREGILEALRGVAPHSQRQVVLVTDGLIGFEQEIVATIHGSLPSGCRVHTVGVGSGVNRTLTSGASRAGRGAEVILGIGEDPEPAAKRLDARTRAPVVVDLEIDGSAVLEHAPARLPDLFQGAPARISMELAPAGGRLRVRGRTADGAWSAEIEVPPAGAGSTAVAKLFGRERVRDLETLVAAGESGRWDEAIEKTGLVFRVATRMTSWVAIDEQRSVDPDVPMRRQRIPQQLPHGMSAEGAGLRSAGFVQTSLSGVAAFAQPSAPAALGERARRAMQPAPPPPARGKARPAAPAGPPAPTAPPAPKAKKAQRRSLAEGIRDFFGVGGRPPEPPQDSEESAEKTLAETRRPLRTLTGRIVRRNERQLVVEVDVSGPPLAWERPAKVEILGDDGSRHEVPVKQGTRSGEVAPGSTLRLVLDVDGVGPGASVRLATIHVQTTAGLVAIAFSS